MPDALIVIEEDCMHPTYPNQVDYARVVEQLVKLGIVKRVSIGKKQTYGRYYMMAASIRKAYYKQTKEK